MSITDKEETTSSFDSTTGENVSMSAADFKSATGGKGSTRIRPHHLLCMAFYQGKGYSQEFCANMDKVVANLHRVEITKGADSICVCCDNLSKVCRVCDCEDKSGRYDKAVLDMLGIKYGESYDYAELYSRLLEKIIREGLLNKVCSDCEWYYICSRLSANIK